VTTIVYQRSNSRIPDFAVQMVEGAGEGQWEALVYYDDETWEFATKRVEDDDGFDVDKYELDWTPTTRRARPDHPERGRRRGSSPSSTSGPTRSRTGAGQLEDVRPAGRHHEDQRHPDGVDGLLRLPAAVRDDGPERREPTTTIDDDFNDDGTLNSTTPIDPNRPAGAGRS
jgi:hypothetical protein